MKNFFRFVVISFACILMMSISACSPTSDIKTTVASISDFGHISLSVSVEEMLKVYSYGDVVIATINGTQHELPVVSNFSDVDNGEKLLLLKEDVPASIGINYGDFAKAVGVTDDMLPIEVNITLKEKGAYLEAWELRHLERSNERNDYSALSDQEYANFRNIATTGMGKNVLYRTSSPIDPEIGRNTYADQALRQAGIKTIINLADEEDDMREFDGFADTYYSKQNISAIHLNAQFDNKSFYDGFARSIRFMVQHPGPYVIHCIEGKDRTGFTCAILECLMGASSKEVIDDYMKTYENFYGIKKSETRHDKIAQDNIVKILNDTFELTDGSSIIDEGIELSSLAEEYLSGKLGLTDDEIQILKQILSQNY